jgi:hypothetical protein
MHCKPTTLTQAAKHQRWWRHRRRCQCPFSTNATLPPQHRCIDANTLTLLLPLPRYRPAPVPLPHPNMQTAVIFFVTSRSKPICTWGLRNGQIDCPNLNFTNSKKESFSGVSSEIQET